MSNKHEHTDHINVSDDLLINSLTASNRPYRSLSAKRLRDPSRRKSVSFNEVPIVHEVPSHDTMRHSNSHVCRSWTYNDDILPYSSSHFLLPFNTTNITSQKFHTHRLNNTLSSPTNHSTLNRFTDWPIRPKTSKNFEESTERHITSTPPLIIVHTPDEKIIKNPSITQSLSLENDDERKHFYHSPLIPNSEHYQTLPFTIMPLSETTPIYTSTLTTNLSQSNELNHNSYIHTIRPPSATLSINGSNNSPRSNDNTSSTSRRTTTNHFSARTVLKPATIAFHSTNHNPPLIITNSKQTLPPPPPTVPKRSSSFIAHSRLLSSASSSSTTSNRPLSSTYKHLTPSTTLTRSRSAHISSLKRNTNSSVNMYDNQTDETNSNNLKRTPHKQTYSSYYMHHILLPTNIN